MKKWLKRGSSMVLACTVFTTLFPNIANPDIVYAKEKIVSEVDEESGAENKEVKETDESIFSEDLLRGETLQELSDERVILPSEVVRGVIDQIDDLPQYENENFLELKKGTPERPFVILEIVPYEDMAEFGYQISGCEPVKVEEMYGRSTMGTIKSLLDADIEQKTAYFFPDEPEGKEENYEPGWLQRVSGEDKIVDGYYEVVEEGTGNFAVDLLAPRDENLFENQSIEQSLDGFEKKSKEASSEIEGLAKTVSMKEAESKGTTPEETNAKESLERKQEIDANQEVDSNLDTKTDEMERSKKEVRANLSLDAGQITIIPKEGGNLIWHTVNDFEKTEYEGISFDGNPMQRLQEIGDRFYTKRESVGENRTLMVTYNYYTYKSKDHFLKNTLGLTEEEANLYSVVIKTITPKELNKSLEQGKDWIKYADLINLSPKSHDTEILKAWKSYNRLNHTSICPNQLPANSFKKGNDISWKVALEIYMRVTEKVDYAAIIVDDTIYNTTGDYDKKNVSIDILDWNMQSSGLTYSTDGYKINVYKLAVMLFSMKPELFRSLYLSGDDPIIKDGKNTKQKGNAAEYWNFYTFLPVPPVMDRPANFQPYDYWNSSEAWDNYGITPTPTNEGYKNWTSGHVFSYKGDNGILRGAYITQLLQNVDKFSDFAAYLQKYGITEPHFSDAVRYILGLPESDTPIEEPDETLRVLDIEPSVDLENPPDGKYKTKWQLTESYIRMLLPTFTGKIEITHQTTAEFNGKVEDLNSTYNMVFLGLDFKAYNTRHMSVQTNNGNWMSGEFPDWNDNSLDGKIYLHTGDAMVSTEYKNGNRNRSVGFLWEGGSNVYSKELRFPGNDISKLKCNELAEFAKAGYPIVASRHLYNLEKCFIDDKSNVYKFVDEYKKDNKGLYSISEPNKILASLGGLKEIVTFTENYPLLYDGSTNGTIITNPNYLPVDSGRSYMEFRFHVEEAGYEYHIYVDSDRDGKFSNQEIIYTGAANAGEGEEGNNAFIYRLPTALVGLLQWKIEVYRTDKPQIRYMKTGCSAARNISGIKKRVNVLQIMPKDGSYSGKLNLQTSEVFRKYYTDLADYDIQVTTITWGTFSGYFSNSNFHYDMSKEIGPETNNPVDEDKINPSANLSGYNMMIVGFGDTYGGMDLSDRKAVEYLQYFIAQGKSILFTHDVTSMYNIPMGGVFGSTANATLRDIMGMNRYKAVSNQLSNNQRNSLIAYQDANNCYDTIDSTAKHGFTYYALKRLGWGTNDNINNHVPYRYMIKGPDNNTVCTSSDLSRKTGFNNNNDETTKVSKLNEGQITVYPYKIDDSFTIAKTHGQWYQLNVEDPEVTVWYCLSNDDVAHGWNVTDNNGQGTALTYQVSPNDASNNYYIYSKGNVFYSGVGHSKVEGDMEAKLFINTMIAAYRASYEPPVFEITNEDAFLNGVQNYSLEVLQEFDNGVTPGAGEAYEGENIQIAETFTDADTVKVTFMPVDFNPVQTTLEGTIYLADGDYIDKIFKLSDDTPINADGNHKFIGLENGREYYLYYKKSELSTHRMLKFELKNNRVTQKSTTNLNMMVRPLFELD